MAYKYHLRIGSESKIKNMKSIFKIGVILIQQLSI